MAERSLAKPLIGVTACVKQFGPHPFHAAGDKYVKAVSDGAGGLPFLLPALGEWYDVADLVDRLDGLMLTGSPSDVEPHIYTDEPKNPCSIYDPQRDATTLPLIRAALDRGLPLLAICRGIQELNVALGGTLYQRVHDVPGKLDHRSRKNVPLDRRYGPVHAVTLKSDGLLSGMAGRDEVMVNSLHGQGINRIAPGLDIEASAPDGIVEAVVVRGADTFALGIQWHPEWRCQENPFSMAIFAAFGSACRTRSDKRKY
jgi:putative glutamine amidotransferase